LENTPREDLIRDREFSYLVDAFYASACMKFEKHLWLEIEPAESCTIRGWSSDVMSPKNGGLLQSGVGIEHCGAIHSGIWVELSQSHSEFVFLQLGGIPAVGGTSSIQPV
jgi:hypothetical protein